MALSVGQVLDLCKVEEKADAAERADTLSTTALASQGQGKDIKRRLKQLNRIQRSR